MAQLTYPLQVTQEENRLLRATEEPGLDGVRATLGLGAVGSWIRARRRRIIRDRAESLRSTQSIPQFESRNSRTSMNGEKSPPLRLQMNGGTDKAYQPDIPSAKADVGHDRSASSPAALSTVNGSYFPPVSHEHDGMPVNSNHAPFPARLDHPDGIPQVARIAPQIPFTLPTPIREMNTARF